MEFGMLFCKTWAFSPIVFVSVGPQPGSCCLPSLFYRMCMYSIVCASHDLSFPQSSALPARHYANLALILNFYLSQA